VAAIRTSSSSIHTTFQQANNTMNTSNSSKVNAAVVKKKNFTTVATKTHDGGAKDTITCEPAAESPRKLIRKHEDPFMYYSQQDKKMQALLLSNEDSGENDDQVSTESVMRKTRISFELHPALMVEDLLPDDVQEVRGVDTNSSGDVIIDELWRLLLCIDDNNDTEM
jgi:hypothetical protein